jgi:hypothetical protein
MNVAMRFGKESGPGSSGEAATNGSANLLIK